MSSKKEQAKAMGTLIANSRGKLNLSQKGCIDFLNEKVNEYKEKENINIGNFSKKTLQQWEQGNRYLKNSSCNCKKMLMSKCLNIPITEFYTEDDIKLFKLLKNDLIKMLTNL